MDFHNLIQMYWETLTDKGVALMIFAGHGLTSAETKWSFFLFTIVDWIKNTFIYWYNFII